jgi:hypothetical protein
MKRDMNIKSFCCFLAMLTMVVTSCSKWDDYRKYTANGEILYTGKLDSVKVYSGKGRVRLYGKLPADPKIVKCKVSWNSGGDSIIFNINKGAGMEVFDQTFAVEEGVKDFKIITSDNLGNSSVVVNATGISYGAAYRRKLNNRPIFSLTYASGNTTVNWDVMDLTTGAQYTETEYVVNGNTMSLQTPVSAPGSVLTGFNFNTTTLRYRTIFKPDSLSIDTFATAFVIR